MKVAGLLALVALVIAGTARAGNVGFEEVRVPNPPGKPIVVGIWYPTDAAPSPSPVGPFTQNVAPGGRLMGERLPLIVMSHGTGGSYEGHYDTALALAHAGFIAAALSHTGDTYDDPSQAATIWARPPQVRRLIDYMLGEWPGHERIDPGKVGMFGFSAGGFTALVIAGGVPDLNRVVAHCQAHPLAFECGLRKDGPADLPQIIASLPRTVWTPDVRVRAAVIAAPALGYTFTGGLENVRIPIQLWRAENDHILLNPDYAEAVRIALPRTPEFHLAENADHFDFLAPCSDALRQAAPTICVSRPGFDRTAFHKRFNAEIAGFFHRTLETGAP